MVFFTIVKDFSFHVFCDMFVESLWDCGATGCSAWGCWAFEWHILRLGMETCAHHVLSYWRGRAGVRAIPSGDSSLLNRLYNNKIEIAISEHLLFPFVVAHMLLENQICIVFLALRFLLFLSEASDIMACFGSYSNIFQRCEVAVSSMDNLSTSFHPWTQGWFEGNKQPKRWRSFTVCFDPLVPNIISCPSLCLPTFNLLLIQYSSADEPQVLIRKSSTF